MTLLGVTAILESAHIYLKAGYAFGFTPLSTQMPAKLVNLSAPEPVVAMINRRTETTKL
jgi:hypothetical protein